MTQKKFIWSTSTCSYQIEGARNLGGRTDSIWDDFTKKNFYIPPVGSPEREINSIEVAADFYHKYKTDAQIMKNAHINGFIYNLDWNRIFPQNASEINLEGLLWTDDFFKTMVQNGVQPIPILFHWDTPMWAQLEGGWENPKIIEWFRIYVATMFKYLGKYTDLWFVNDENSSFTLLGYLSDFFPPARTDKTAFVKAIHHLNMAAAVAKVEFEKAKAVGYLNPEAKLGIDHDWNPPIPYDKNDLDDVLACEKYNDWFLNFWLDPNLKGQYPKVFFEWIKAEKIDFEIPTSDLQFLQENCLDFIGWNYYRPCYVMSAQKELSIDKIKRPTETFFDQSFKVVYPIDGVEYTDWKWIIDASQLVPGAQKLAARYGQKMPLMIVENGMGAFDDKTQLLIKDTYRIEYLKKHIDAVMKGRELGINFIGYSLWTYCDIFSPSGGYRKDYGLVAVDFTSPLRTRKPKLSYSWYKQVTQSDGQNTTADWTKLENNLIQELANQDLFKQ